MLLAGVALVSNIPAPPLSLIICALYLGNSVIPIEGVIAPPRIRLISRPDNLGPEYQLLGSLPDTATIFGGNLPAPERCAWCSGSQLDIY